MDREEQNRLIVDQFTRQAEPFARHPAHSVEESMRLVREAVGIGAEDTVLDVACGPGLVACDFAAHARRVTGIDLTPAMIEQARVLQESRGLDNLEWRAGDVASLPFDEGSFSVVFTRYSFHHLPDPAAVLAEMARVARPGGRVAVVDVYSRNPEQGEAYDRVERLRDPSHVRALGLEELMELFERAGLERPAMAYYGVDVALESLLASSFPEPGAAEEVRRTFAEDVGIDRLRVDARRVDGELWFTFPIAVLVGRKPAAIAGSGGRPVQGVFGPGR
jgi:SAM-dependent methyltransferase